MARRRGKGTKALMEIRTALDRGLGRFLGETQGKLNKNAPVATGRFASSWFIGQDTPNRSEAAIREKGTTLVEITKFTGNITIDSKWYISNNLPYAERVCLDPKYAKNGAGGSAWFTTIVNNLGRDAQDAFDFHLKKVR